MMALRKALGGFALLASMLVGASSPDVSGSAMAASPGTAGSSRPSRRDSSPPDTRPRTLVPYFTRAGAEAKSAEKDGFIQRWLLLEPLPNQLRTNAGFTEAFVRSALQPKELKDQANSVPTDGQTLTIKGQELCWHALDSTLFNVKLFRFAYGLGKPIYGVTFFVCTVVECPEELNDVRMAVGSNGASMWWVNGEEAVGLFGDRRMVVDDCVSRRLTLRKGRNVVRGAVINGPGMSDFCVRFVDESGNPVKALAVNLDASRH